MKILIVSARYYPETFSITNIAEELVKMGNDVTVLTGKPSYGLYEIYSGYSNIENQTINGVKIIRLNEKIRKKGFFSLVRNYLSIFHIYNSYLKKCNTKYDAVLSHVVSPIFSIHGVGRFCKKQNIPHMHYGLDLWPESLVATGFVKKNSIVFKMMKKYCKKIYNTCDLITFASPCTESYFHDFLKIKVPFKHIYQPCLTKLPSEEMVNNHLFKESSKCHILYCGSVARFHHLDLFIKSISASSCKDQLTVTIVGSGSELENIKKLVSDLNLNDVVTFTGRVSPKDTINFYVKADVLFAPLYNNSFTSYMIPQKVIEYFMYSRPILGMLVGDGKELITQASKLNVVCDQTIESLSNAIDHICSMNEEEMTRCGLENRAFFVKNKRFQLPIICEELESSLVSLINNK